MFLALSLDRATSWTPKTIVHVWAGFSETTDKKIDGELELELMDLSQC